MTAFGHAARAALATAKEVLKDVTEAKATHVSKHVLTAHVVLLALLWVAKHLIGVSHKFELFLFGIARIHVWVQLTSQLAICLFDLFCAGIASNA